MKKVHPLDNNVRLRLYFRDSAGVVQKILFGHETVFPWGATSINMVIMEGGGTGRDGDFPLNLILSRTSDVPFRSVPLISNGA